MNLRVEGKWILDENNNRIALRGGGMDYTCYDGAFPLESYLETLRTKGCNTVRLAFAVPNWSTGHTEYDVAKMNNTLNLLASYGLNAILDCHDNNEHLLNPAFQAAWLETWRQIAINHGGHPSVIAYELCNEACNSPYDDVVFNLMKTCMNTIKSVHPDALFIVFELVNREKGIGRASYRPRHVAEMPDTIFTLHHWNIWYREDPARYKQDFAFGECQASEFINFANKYRDLMNAPVWLGEFGAYDYNTANAGMAEVKHIIELAEKQSLGWNVWMMEKGYNWNFLVPRPFINPYFGEPAAFNPIPFNLQERIVASSGIYQQEPTYILLKDDGTYIDVSGPCKVRIRYWVGLAQTGDWSTPPKPDWTFEEYIQQINGPTRIVNEAGTTENSTEIYPYSTPTPTSPILPILVGAILIWLITRK